MQNGDAGISAASCVSATGEGERSKTEYAGATRDTSGSARNDGRNPGNPRESVDWKSDCFTNGGECQKSSAGRNDRKKESYRSVERKGRGKRRKYWKKRKYGTYVGWKATTLARLGHLGDFADTLQTRSRDQIQWPVAVKKGSGTKAALFAVIDDAYVRAFVK